MADLDFPTERIRRYATRLFQAAQTIYIDLAVVAQHSMMRIGIGLYRLWHAFHQLYAALQQFGARRKQEHNNMPEMMEIWADDTDQVNTLYTNLTETEENDSSEDN